MIGSIATDYQSAVFCAVITHDGQSANGFVECQDDTVNTAGTGSYVGVGEPKKGVDGMPKGEGRELLDRIDL